MLPHHISLIIQILSFVILSSSMSPQETNDGLAAINPLNEGTAALFVSQDLLRRIDKRHTKKKEDSAEVMVQNILKWLQNVYGQNSRKIRQGSREYLPPINTEKPRPFQPGGPYPPSGSVRPSPSFPTGTEKPYQPPYSPGPKPTEDIYTSNPSRPTAPTSPTRPIGPTGPVGPTGPSGPTGPGSTDVETGITEEGKPSPSTNEIYTPSTGGSPSYRPPTAQTPSYGGQPTPEGTDGKPSQTFPDDDLNHPPHIHAIDVQCSKEQMTVNIEFNREYNGIIYSKGHYNEPNCRYVNENSGQSKYTFTLSLNTCGTEFISAFETEGQSYLENVLVLQNEPGIQEVWDSIKAVRCLWEGSVNQALSVALSVGMLSQEIVTFSGDTAMARLDIQVGRGPFAPAANGLVKIGEIMTLVVSVSGDPDFDIQVRDCKARDDSGANSVQLTDENGCVLKPKLIGSFQKTRDTQNTGASIIAYAFFSAFKFPDVMDLILECNIELCKTDCQMCPNPDQKIDPGRRKRRSVENKTYFNKNELLKYRYRRNIDSKPISEPVKISHKFQVILPEEILSDKLGEENKNLVLQLSNQKYDSICMSVNGFLFSFVSLALLLIISAVFSATMWLKYQRVITKL